MIHTRGDGGKNLQVYDMDFGKVSGLICGEHDQSLLKQRHIVQGTQVNCSMWPGYLGGAEELPAMTQAMAGIAAGSSAAGVKDLWEKVAELERKLQALQKSGE